MEGNLAVRHTSALDKGVRAGKKCPQSVHNVDPFTGLGWIQVLQQPTERCWEGRVKFSVVYLFSHGFNPQHQIQYNNNNNNNSNNNKRSTMRITPPPRTRWEK